MGAWGVHGGVQALPADAVEPGQGRVGRRWENDELLKPFPPSRLVPLLDSGQQAALHASIRASRPAPTHLRTPPPFRPTCQPSAAAGCSQAVD
jgi:hypothetical protein